MHFPHLTFSDNKRMFLLWTYRNIMAIFVFASSSEHLPFIEPVPSLLLVFVHGRTLNS